MRHLRERRLNLDFVSRLSWLGSTNVALLPLPKFKIRHKFRIKLDQKQLNLTLKSANLALKAYFFSIKSPAQVCCVAIASTTLIFTR